VPVIEYLERCKTILKVHTYSLHATLVILHNPLPLMPIYYKHKSTLAKQITLKAN